MSQIDWIFVTIKFLYVRFLLQQSKQNKKHQISRLVLFDATKDTLRAFALIYRHQDLDVQDNETPELIGFEIHPELFGFREFL